VRNITSWSADLTVETGGQDVINHAGTAALRLITDRTGLTAGLSQALARRGSEPVHDRGRVLADTAVMIADGLPVPRDSGQAGIAPDDLCDNLRQWRIVVPSAARNVWTMTLTTTRHRVA
jgi:hypothetical protein